MKILIVDDDQETRKILRLIASRAFHEVLEAENGQEGLRLAAEQKPELIISDALMPVMDGFFFLREIKRNEVLRGIPFIFYSGTYTEKDDIRLASSMGAAAYIVKPKEPEELWAEIGQALERHKREPGIRPPSATPEGENEQLRQHAQIMALKLEQAVTKLQEALATQKRSEEALRLKLERLKKFFSAVPDLLCVIDASGRFSLVNAAWERTLGYTRQELLGEKLADFLYPDDINPTKEALASLAAGKEAGSYENRCRCKDGTYLRLEWRSSAAGEYIYATARCANPSAPGSVGAEDA